MEYLAEMETLIIRAESEQLEALKAFVKTAGTLVLPALEATFIY